MKATDMLMDEHEVIKRVLNCLEMAASSLEQDHPVRTGFFLDAAAFMRGFVDGCHHMKEEKVLFVAMAEHGVPTHAGPLPVMLNEHDQGRKLAQALAEAAPGLGSGGQNERVEVIETARAYTRLLRHHIAKENGILFPMANQIIPPDEQDLVADDFERVESVETGEGVHEKYLALVDALENEIRM